MDKQKVITAIQSANKGSPFITQTRLASIMRKEHRLGKAGSGGAGCHPS